MINEHQYTNIIILGKTTQYLKFSINCPHFTEKVSKLILFHHLRLLKILKKGFFVLFYFNMENVEEKNLPHTGNKQTIFRIRNSAVKEGRGDINRWIKRWILLYPQTLYQH